MQTIKFKQGIHLTVKTMDNYKIDEIHDFVVKKLLELEVAGNTYVPGMRIYISTYPSLDDMEIIEDGELFRGNNIERS